MKDEQLLNSLFELARKEAPKRSFEEIEEVFYKQVSLQSGLSSATLFKYISLNQLILLLISALISSYILFRSPDSSDNKQEEIPLVDSLISEPIYIDSTPAESRIDSSFDKAVKDFSDKKTSTAPDFPPTGKKQTQEKEQSPILLHADTFALREDKIRADTIQLKNSIPERIQVAKADTDQETILSGNSEKTINLTLKKEDNLGEVEYFNETLEKYGFSIKARTKFSSGDEFLAEYFCHFKHAEGLNFKLFGSGFDQLEIILSLNAKGEVIHFKYRFNQESFTRDIPLKLSGKKSYFYGKGFSGMSGSTNINIEN